MFKRWKLYWLRQEVSILRYPHKPPNRKSLGLALIYVQRFLLPLAIGGLLGLALNMVGTTTPMFVLVPIALLSLPFFFIIVPYCVIAFFANSMRLTMAHNGIYTRGYEGSYMAGHLVDVEKQITALQAAIKSDVTRN